MSRRAKIIWLVVGAMLLLALLLVLHFIPYYGQICEAAGAAKVADCTSYQLLPFIVFEAAQFFDKMGGAITALATIAIAIFTFTLKRATDKLWDAGERQLNLLAQTSAAQSRDMQASIQAATDSAKAARRQFDSTMEKLVDIGFKNYEFIPPSIPHPHRNDSGRARRGAGQSGNVRLRISLHAAWPQLLSKGVGIQC